MPRIQTRSVSKVKAAISVASPGRDDKGFGKLLSDIPVMMLPVRVETRFFPYRNGAKKRELHIRVYPDQIHLDDHQISLSAPEVEAGKQFHEQLSAAAGDTEAMRAAWRGLVAAFGPRRASWIARNILNASYTEQAPDERHDSARVRLLPNRWLALGYVGGKEIFRHWAANAVAEDLIVGLGSAEQLQQLGPEKPPYTAEAAWMFDFNAALQKGMGIKIPLGNQLAAIERSGLELVVLGVDNALNPDEAGKQLEALLESHHYTQGIDFMAQGTPTNNTETVVSGWTSSETDTDGILEREVLNSQPLPGIVTKGTAKEANGANGVLAKQAFGMAMNRMSILDRLGDSSENGERHVRAMNQALWPVTWGQYLGEMLASRNRSLLSANLPGIKEWFNNRVTGGVPLPTLRVGFQPYGVLPIQQLSGSRKGKIEKNLDAVIGKLREGWRKSLPNVPRMDPTLDNTTATSADSELVKVLSSQPHPWQFSVRELWDGNVLLKIFFALARNSFSSGGIYGELGFQNRLDRELGSARSVDAQIAVFERLRTDIGNEFLKVSKQIAPLLKQQKSYQQTIKNLQKQKSAVRNARVKRTLTSQINGFNKRLGDVGNTIKTLDNKRELLCGTKTGATRLNKANASSACKSMIDLLNNAYRSRIPPLTDLYTALGKPYGDYPLRIADSHYGSDEQLWNALKAPLVAGSADTDKPGSYIKRLIDNQSVSISASTPLLCQLLSDAKRSEKDQTAFRKSLEVLAGLSSDELERLMKETLGLASHRLDAWATSLASRSLESMRRSKRTGIQIGAYGWVENLRPADSPVSQGYLHAPSLHHAATGAVLRSGWSAHGGESEESPLAVDVSSARVRLADWILGGIRQGWELGELLGGYFERGLHDGKFDFMISACRLAVLNATGEQGKEPTRVVDGLKLLELCKDERFLNSLKLKVQRSRGTVGLAEFGSLISRFVQAYDAVADGLFFESVHHLVGGDLTRASASLDSISRGEVAPAELSAMRTPRSGTAINHRVQILLPTQPGPGSGWAESPRSRFDPLLEAWAARLLGNPGRIACRMELHDADSGKAVHAGSVSLADLGCSALDAVFETPQAEASGLSGLERRMAAFFVGGYSGTMNDSMTIRVLSRDAGDDADVSFADFVLLSAALRRLIGKARALRASDLAVGDVDNEAQTDIPELTGRAEGVLDSFRQAITDLRKAVDSGVADAGLKEQMSKLSGFDVPHAIVVDDSGDLQAQAKTLLSDVEERLARIDAKLEASSMDACADEVIALMFGAGFRALPRFTPGNSGELLQSLKRSTKRQGDYPLAAMEWMQQMAKVRPETGNLADVVRLSEMLSDRSTVPLTVGQLPDNPDEPWVAIHKPDPDSYGDRTSMLLAGVEHAPLQDENGQALPCSGLVVDQWMETIPSAHETTSVGFHFDAPGSQPPQSILLAMPPEGKPWDVDTMAGTLRETFEWAKLRMVGPETLEDFGHHLPAVFTKTKLHPGV